jgi:hypothetical protein
MKTGEIATWLIQVINRSADLLAAADQADAMSDDDAVYQAVAQVESPGIFVLPCVQTYPRLTGVSQLVVSDFVLGSAKRLSLMVGAMAVLLNANGLNDEFSVAVLDTRTKHGFVIRHLGDDDVGIAPIYAATDRA